mmetsp:Transcript_39850/g.106859  ORF Transcript_39850/g.106859 Transcript_39850/m.106859 type:complete len:279 (-) Transcript_39850:461-1297(-)
MLEKLHQVVEMRSPLLLLTVRLSQHQRVLSIVSIPVAAPCLVRPTKHEGCVRVAILDAELRDLVHDLVAIYAAEPIVVVHEPVQAVALGQLPLPPPHLHVAEVVVPQPPFLDAERLPDLRSLERPQQRPLCKIRPPELVVLGDGVVLGKKHGHGPRRRRDLSQLRAAFSHHGRNPDLDQRQLRIPGGGARAAKRGPQSRDNLGGVRGERREPRPVIAADRGHRGLMRGGVPAHAGEALLAEQAGARRMVREAGASERWHDVARLRCVVRHGAQRRQQT